MARVDKLPSDLTSDSNSDSIPLSAHLGILA